MIDDMIGKTFGRLTVIEKDESRKDRAFFVCRCECGNIKSIYMNHLKSGSTTSCGCYRKEQFSSRLTKHGMSNTKIYRVWSGMIERCTYKKHKTYNDYGGRGIVVCDEWLESFENFYSWSCENGYEEGLTIERINNNGNYEPDNCKWVTLDDQRYNKRNTVIITINGVSKNLKEWSEELNIKLSTLRDRYYRRKTFPPKDK